MSERVEEPTYEITNSFRLFEIRQYHNSIEAQFSTKDNPNFNPSISFRNIANYIFGQNSKSQKISMTAPVQQWKENGLCKMAFTLPKKHKFSELPKPNNKSIKLLEVIGKLIAAIKFSGFSNDKKVEKITKKLFNLISENGFESTGPPVLAVYDRPTTLPFLRRNEILIPVKIKSN
ncbi:MAG: SOUL heme-binding protein [Euryarchaeota archaeon]|nr:SOUL heme-binding protein [Euryarchaeota archaeon]|tara:strand:+ start:1187 stop:1714 length:528 start_codon:yes stop_codon:yes gene_type:complete